MTDIPGWDYSQIPEREWKWFFESEHWIDLVVSPVGLNYYGTDWTCQSGGGYLGVFRRLRSFSTKGQYKRCPEK